MTRPRRHSTRAARPRWVAGGFTLIELALAFFIIGLVLGGILYPLSAQVAQRQATESQQQLEEIRDALVGFAAANGYLPCPDTTGNGSENVTAGACTTIGGNGIAHGNLPWVTLGLGHSDIWGNRFRYAVEAAFAQRSPSTPFTLSTSTNDIRVCPTAATCASALTTTAVAVILSHGANGFGGTRSVTGTANPAATSADEVENTDGDRDFVQRPVYTGSVTASEFDDFIIWLSRHTLVNQMIAAGKLP